MPIHVYCICTIVHAVNAHNWPLTRSKKSATAQAEEVLCRIPSCINHMQMQSTIGERGVCTLRALVLDE